MNEYDKAVNDLVNAVNSFSWSVDQLKKALILQVPNSIIQFGEIIKIKDIQIEKLQEELAKTVKITEG